ncbi:type II toxin-antitoxin system PemK/MazF family toxin [Thalassospira profundimaris]|uniref:type II toxin-antitoxin system PemK/MazF family toxin n=1 Tax=Thalassospira profundimaris TaxID=502049 RepID=UPI003857888C
MEARPPRPVHAPAHRHGGAIEGLLLLDRGDLVWLDFNPQAGYDQPGHRLDLVLSPKAYHQIRGGR